MCCRSIVCVSASKGGDGVGLFIVVRSEGVVRGRGRASCAVRGEDCIVRGVGRIVSWIGRSMSVIAAGLRRAELCVLERRLVGDLFGVQGFGDYLGYLRHRRFTILLDEKRV